MKELIKEIKLPRLIAAIALIAFGVLGRMFLAEIPNIETVTAASLLAGCLIGGVYILIVPIAIMLLTDLYIGNNWIFLFTWSGFIFIGVLGFLLRKRAESTPKFLAMLTGAGVLGTVLYWTWTNIGFWLLMGIYPLTFEGLMLCFFMALPFLKLSLISTIAFVPSVSIIALHLKQHGLSLKAPALNIEKCTSN